jgi:adenylate cyclase
MTLKEDLVAARDDIVSSNFAVRSGAVVPRTEDVGYNEAVKLAATYLYADMVDSSGLVAASPRETVGKVLRLYLDLTVRIIRARGGHIRSFDGDRVMGIFIGTDRHDAAAKAALQIRWACDELIQPKIHDKYKSVRESGWTLKPGCGIASGEAFLIRGGVRKTSSDLVSVGVAPNLAAKLSDIRDAPYAIRIGAATYKSLSDKARLSNGTDMWQGTYQLSMGGSKYSYYRSSYRWAIT